MWKGSKIQTGFCMVEKRLGYKWSEFWIASEIDSNGHHSFKKYLKSGQNCPDFEWKGP